MVVDGSVETLTKQCADGWDLENFCVSLHSHTALLINLLEMLVLSDDRMMPKRVLPSGSSFYRKIHKDTSMSIALGLACKSHMCSPMSHSSYTHES